MIPLILHLHSSAVEHHRSRLTRQALADALAEALPQALALFDAGLGHAATIANSDMAGLPASQVLTLQIASLDHFLAMDGAANEWPVRVPERMK